VQAPNVVTDLMPGSLAPAEISAVSVAGLTICICSHNPRGEVLYRKVLPALQRQTVAIKGLSLLIVDNASDPPIDLAACCEAAGSRVDVRLVREAELGVVHARARVAADTSTQWILFIDDDLEIAEDYIEKGLRIIANNPEIGCFGGKLELPNHLKPTSWVRPLLPFLAIRDAGDEPITRCTSEWGPWEPPSAGCFVRRRVLLRYLTRVRTDANTHRLGRKGRRSLFSCEDALIMRGACEDGLSCSYQPTLLAHHHLDDRRFRFSYLLRLMYGYGRSTVVLSRVLRPERVSGEEQTNATVSGSPVKRISWFYHSFLDDCQQSWRYALCRTAFRLGYYLEERNYYLNERNGTMDRR
jgi:glycosyltransferase involved in cell wall biosynthesis